MVDLSGEFILIIWNVIGMTSQIVDDLETCKTVGDYMKQINQTLRYECVPVSIKG